MSIVISGPLMSSTYKENWSQSASKIWMMRAANVLNTVGYESVIDRNLGSTGGLQIHDAGQEAPFRISNKYKLEFETRGYTDRVSLERKSALANEGLFQGEIIKKGKEGPYKIQNLVSKWLATNPTCLSGSALFYTAHSMGNSGTFNNALTATELTALNVDTATAPTVEEAVPILAGLIGKLQALPDDMGEAMNLGANKFVVSCSTPEYFAAFQGALIKTNLADNETNTVAAFVSSGQYEIDVVLQPSLTGTNMVYLFNATEGSHAFTVGIEGPHEVIEVGPGTESFDKKKICDYQAQYEIGYGALFPQHAIRGTLS